jgi:hypothetical protein
MPEIPRGECRSCGAAVPYLAPTCRGCGASNQPNPVVAVSAVLALLLLGGLIALGVRTFHGAPAGPAGAEAPAASPSAQSGSEDYGWIVAAMAECDEEAKRSADALRFLIVPVVPTGMSLPGWSANPIADMGSSGKLLSSTDALIGLRNRVLTLYQKPLAFALSDTKTGTTYKWRPGNGVTAVNTKEALSDNLKLGFDMPEVADETVWGPTVGVKKDSCYWINLLVLAPAHGG